MRAAASLLAGGLGHRMESDTPKQFLHIRQKPIIAHTLKTVLDSRLFDTVCIAIHPNWEKTLREILDKYFPGCPVSVVHGGATRQASSYAVLQFLAAQGNSPEVVLIHDVARCLVSADLLSRCLSEATRRGAATAAVSSIDTVAVVKNGKIDHVPPRESLVRIQTPQGFRFDMILDAHRQAQEKGITHASDDAQLMLNMGKNVFIVEGPLSNIKVSTPEDLHFAKQILTS